MNSEYLIIRGDERVGTDYDDYQIAREHYFLIRLSDHLIATLMHYSNIAENIKQNAYGSLMSFDHIKVNAYNVGDVITFEDCSAEFIPEAKFLTKGISIGPGRGFSKVSLDDDILGDFFIEHCGKMDMDTEEIPYDNFPITELNIIKGAVMFCSEDTSTSYIPFEWILK